MNETTILGIKISIIKSKKEVIDKITDFLKDGGQHYLITANAEIILAAQHDEEYFYILNSADLVLPDGSGPQIAMALNRAPSQRYAGVDLTNDILDLAAKNDKKIAILCWKDGLSGAEEIKNAINKKYSGLKMIVKDIDRVVKMPYYDDVKVFGADILFVALGAPWQEKLIYHNLKNLPTIKLAIGVGGTFDIVAGKLKRAPKLLRLFGLEWLWRVIRQPRRWKRIYNATIVFSYKYFKYRFIYPYLYRPNVACLLYKYENNKYHILLVERTDEPGHWQIPQGGTDGLDLVSAGTKELQEEINSDKFKVLATYKNQYKWRNYFKENKIKHAGYKGQKQGLLIAEFFGNDDDIKINFWDHSAWKWVGSESFVNEVHKIRKESAKIYLTKFKKLIENKNNI